MLRTNVSTRPARLTLAAAGADCAAPTGASAADDPPLPRRDDWPPAKVCCWFCCCEAKPPSLTVALPARLACFHRLAQLRQRGFDRFAHLRVLRHEQRVRVVVRDAQHDLQRPEIGRIERQFGALLVCIRQEHDLLAQCVRPVRRADVRREHVRVRGGDRPAAGDSCRFVWAAAAAVAPAARVALAAGSAASLAAASACCSPDCAFALACSACAVACTGACWWRARPSRRRACGRRSAPSVSAARRCRSMRSPRSRRVRTPSYRLRASRSRPRRPSAWRVRPAARRGSSPVRPGWPR